MFVVMWFDLYQLFHKTSGQHSLLLCNDALIYDDSNGVNQKGPNRHPDQVPLKAQQGSLPYCLPASLPPWPYHQHQLGP